MGKIENSLQASTLTQSPVAEVSLKKMLKKVKKQQTSCLSEYQVCNNNLTTSVRIEMLYFEQEKIEKSSDLAKSLGYNDDDIKTIDSSWIQRFRKRHQICLEIQSCESASVSHESIEKWINERLSLHCQKFHLVDIFNADECSLLWKLLPDCSLAFKSENAMVVRDKIACSSMAGEKLPLLVIGKSQTLDAFEVLFICLSNIKAISMIR